MTESPYPPRGPEQAPARRPRSRTAAALIGLYALACVIGLALVLFSGTKEKRGFFAAHMKPSPAIAILQVYGPITVTQDGPLSQAASSDRIVRRLKSLGERDDVRAIVLRVNSPGGSVGAVQEIYEELLKLKASGKKIVVSIGDVAASGGYYIAAAADKIYAEPGAITGSIGVIFQTGNVQELFKKVGVKIVAIKSSEHKDIGSPFRPMTEQELKMLQTMINDAYDQFVTAIVDGRKMDRAKLLPLADGRIYTGRQAKAQGLIDEFGNLETAIEGARQLAGIEGKPRLIKEEERFGQLLTMLSGRSSAGIWERLSATAGVRFAYLWEHAL